MPPGSRVAIPAFACPAVARAVRRAGLVPYLCDLRDNGDFWSDYNLPRLQAAAVRAVVLVHLFGALHPQTGELAAACRGAGIRLLHDAAQSYGVDTAALKGDGGFISFGSGKASSAAYGAVLFGAEPPHGMEPLPVMRRPLLRRLTDLRGRLFWRARRYEGGQSWLDHFQEQMLGKLLCGLRGGRFYRMTDDQQQAAAVVLAAMPELALQRQRRWELVQTALRQHPHLRLAVAQPPAQAFKAIIYIEPAGAADFCDYLLQHGVPYARLWDELPASSRHHAALPNLRRYAPGFVEISTEASIPLIEVGRVAGLLHTFRRPILGQ